MGQQHVSGSAWARGATAVAVTALMANVGALVELAVHPDIPYFDPEHLLVGGFTAAVTAMLLGALWITVARGEVKKRRVEDSARAREARLRESEDKFRLLFNSSTDAVLVHAHNPGAMPGRFIEVNDEACRRYGYTREELLQLTPMDLDAPEGLAAIPAAMEALARDGHARWEGVHRTRDGRKIESELSNVVFALGGRTVMLATARDITERKRLEAQIAQADRLASMGTMAAGVGHEINNPLTYVLQNLESLTEDLPNLAAAAERVPPALEARGAPSLSVTLAGHGAPSTLPEALHDLAERAQEAYDGALRIKAVTRGLSTFARDDRKELSPVDLRRPIEAAVRMASNEVRHRARLVTTFGDVPEVWASEGKLAQVFLNLVLNAAHAIHEGHADDHVIEVRTWAEGAHACVEVRDTGAGIAEEHLSRIFEPFFTTKGPGRGSGLGLSICRNIVTELGGDIRVESEVGRGTRVVVRLPARKETSRPPAIETVKVARGPLVGRGRLLVVDDEEAVRRAIVRLLGRDHEIVTATSGAHARELLQADAEFDAILCDLMMPDTTGMELHAWLAAERPSLASRMVFITGGAFTPSAVAFLASVDNATLEKPFDVAVLKRVVLERVAARRSERPT
jgi:PAS domain S-box-containing protein